MIRRVTLFAVSLLLLSCGTSKLSTIDVHHVEYKDKEVIVRDTITEVVQDEALLTALLECDSLGRIRISELTTVNGKLSRINAELRENSLKITSNVVYRDRVKELRTKDHLSNKSDVVVPSVITKEVRGRLYWWQRLLVWVGVIYIAQIGLKIALNPKALFNRITFKNLLTLFKL